MRKVNFKWKTPKALRFLESQVKLSMFIGGVRSSKTFTGAVKGCFLALQNKGSLGIAMSPTYAMLSDVMIPTYSDILQNWFGLKLKKDFKLRESSRPELAIRNCGTIKFRSAEVPERIEGLTADWFHEDEAAQSKYKAHKICLDRVSHPRVLPRGIGFITTTPKGHNWVYDLYTSSFTDPDHFAQIILTSEAGLVDQIEIDYARSHMDARYFRQQYEATFEAWAGVVYDEFTRANNVKSLTYDPKLINYIGIDCGWTDETAILWYQHNSITGEWYLLREFIESYIKPSVIADVIRGNKVTLSGGRVFQAPYSLDKVERIYPGTDVNNKQQAANGLSIRNILVANGIHSSYFRVKAHRVFESIHSVRAKIMGADGVVRLFVDPSCKRYIADKGSYHYSEKDGIITGEIPDKGQENHRYSHSNDAERNVIDAVEPVRGRITIGGLV